MKTICLSVLFTFIAMIKTAAQVPIYNSYSPASAVLFLDFDGHTLEGTNWNMDGPLYCGPSNLNSTQITEIFNRVAEDFRPFNLNVTTDSAIYAAAPVDQRMRVLFTITSDWYGVAGGVAYTNSFTWGNNTPCFVFTALHKYKIKNIAEAASHEAGHTLGLRHQATYDTTCAKLTDYNSGAGSGIAGWAPIMGLGYYRNATTWHNGPNPYGCANAQDDLALIARTENGFGFRTDDNTATAFEAAVPLNADATQLSAEGLISTNTDTDLFKFTMPASGPLLLEVQPYSIAANDEGSNLDVEVQLYNSEQNLIDTYNPIQMLRVAIDTTLSSGDYFVAVSGASNPFSSNYASLGTYSIKGTVPDIKPLPLRTLQIQGTVTRNQHELNWIIDADEKITKLVLERADNTSPFTTLANLFSEIRTYTNYAAKTAQYRLSVVFDNGRHYYSNTLSLPSNPYEQRPQLHTTFLQSNNVMVSSPGKYQFTITTMAGQQIKSGQVTEGSNSISMGFLKSGLYVISFQNGTDRVVEKFIKP